MASKRVCASLPAALTAIRFDRPVSELGLVAGDPGGACDETPR